LSAAAHRVTGPAAAGALFNTCGIRQPWVS